MLQRCRPFVMQVLPLAILGAALLAPQAICAAGTGAGADGNEPIAVIGTGHVGTALGPRLGAAGHPIIYGARVPDDPAVKALVAKSGPGALALTPAAAAARAQVILFAVPWASAERAIQSLGDLTGKVIIDPTNPLGHDDKTNQPVEFSLPTSGAEMIQSWAPGAHVVKAFDTTNWMVLADPRVAEGPTSIPLASDDEAAKARVMKIVQELGFEPVDAGPLRNAKQIEGMALLYIRIKLRHPQDAYEFYLRPRQKRAAVPGTPAE